MRQSSLAKLAICALMGVVCVLAVTPFSGPAEAADGSSTAAQATLPMRWRVAHAAEVVDQAGIVDFCATVVVVTNTTNKTVSAELEWFSAPGLLLDTESFSLTALQSKTVGTDDEVLVGPFTMTMNSGQADFTGFAQVYANDPRIMVSAYLICRDSVGATQNLTAMLSVPTFAVGETLEYFQASAPTIGGLPPMVRSTAPEVPQK